MLMMKRLGASGGRVVRHVDQHDVREFPHQGREQSGITGRQVKARHISRGLLLEHARRRDDKEVHVERIPVDFAQARHARGDRRTRNIESERVTHPYAECFRNAVLDGKLRVRSRRAPPATGRNTIVRLDFARP